MRQIKFRAWDKKNKRWCYFHIPNFQPETQWFESENWGWITLDTGLKDKNGKEIYAGDILFNKIKHGVVQWSDKYMGWMSSEIHKMGGEGVYEVIGNIYETPELSENKEIT